ncbi:TIGR04141 family sporadically distributed protein [Idiomarina seosinensis]|uniref:DUF6119 family protein n=1 Tax=Idiomarina seosinensis TaxID=281739 RepID=UPI003850232D
MAKSRSFSIYLLKQGFDKTNAMCAGHGLVDKTGHAKKLPLGTFLFIADNQPKEPWWKSYWGITDNLEQVLKSAILFIQVNNRWLALTFGHAYHNLKNESYEYDFGLRTTLNAIDPDKIRATDILQPEDAKRERIQSPIASDLTFFDIDSDESILRRLTGSVRSDLQPYFSNATGANNVRVTSNVDAGKIVKLCERLLGLYKKDDFKKDFPELQNIVPVKDPSLLSRLDTALTTALKNKKKELVLSVPDLLEHDKEVKFAYSGAHGPRTTYDNVKIDDYRNFLKSRKIESPSIQQLKHHKLNVKDENDQTVKSYSIYQSLLFECELKGVCYHLCEGNWFKIEKDFVNKVKKEIDPFFTKNSILTECNDRLEADYNNNLAKNNGALICLDTKNISPPKQKQVEPCDIFTISNNTVNLIHIKISTRSSSLSHLFNQGVNSVELLRLEEESRKKLIKLVGEKFENNIKNGPYIVTFGIITHKPESNKSNALPIFSRISLRRAIRSLKLMGIDCEVVLIADKVTR